MLERGSWTGPNGHTNCLTPCQRNSSTKKIWLIDYQSIYKVLILIKK